MTLPTAVAQAMKRSAEIQPNGGYGPHAYRFEDHGLDPQEEREKFRPYLLHFGIAPKEVSAREDAAAQSGRDATRRMAIARMGPNAGAAS